MKLSMGRHKQIERSAAAWLARRDHEGWSKDDEAALEVWLSQTTAHRVAFTRLETVWQKAARLQSLAAGTAPRKVPARGEWPQSPFSSSTPDAAVPGSRSVRAVTDTVHPMPLALRTADLQADAVTRLWLVLQRKPFTWAAAAALLVTAVGLGWMLLLPGVSYRTAKGSIEAVPMQDGSTITLNTDSEIRVAITQTERRVDLEQGEAFFEVAKDEKRPFVVRAGHDRIIAVGTKFSVRREADNVRVIVTEGKVRVEHAGSQRQTPPALIVAGSIAVAGDAGVLVGDEALPELQEHLSWREGFVTFHGTPLADAVAEFNRYSARPIVIDDPALASIRIGGNFRFSNAEGFVRLLAEAFPIRVEETEERITLRHQ